MNRTASIRIKGLNLVEIRENLPFIALVVLSLISMLIGVLSTNSIHFRKFSEDLFSGFIYNRNSSVYFEKFISVAWSTLKYPIISFLCSTSVLGIALSPLALIYVSFCYGVIAANFYVNYGITGIVFNLFVLLLPSVIMLFTMIISVKECIAFSLKIARICTRDTRPVNLYQNFRFLCLKHLLLILPIFLSVFIDTAFFDLFKKFINI